MGIFGSEKEKGELVLVFDVGSSSVGGALFYMRKSGIPKIVFTISEPIMLEKVFDVDQFLYFTIKSLEIIVNKICLTGLGAPKKIFCVLASPWYIYQTRMIKFAKNTPFIFTTKLADSVIQKEITLFGEENLAKDMNTSSPVRLIEVKNIKTTLNGYETLTPFNQKAKELEMNVFISMSPEQVLGAIEKTIRKHFHFKEIKFSSFVMASFAVVRDMYINQANFLLIDVGGEVTDISMVKRNILRESISFPLGLNFLIRGVALALNCSLSEAKSYLSLFRDEHVAEPVAKQLAAIISKLKVQWLQKFQQSLANLSGDISVPATVYMAVDKNMSDFFCQLIKDEQFNQYTLAESIFKINFLGTEVFHGLAEFGDNAVRDSFLVIDSIYINRFFN